VTKMRPRSNSVEDHPQLTHNGHPVDGAQVGAGSVWPKFQTRRNLCVQKVPPCFQICLDWSESYLFKVVSKYTKNLFFSSASCNC
jgi:hypothetical protein